MRRTLALVAALALSASGCSAGTGGDDVAVVLAASGSAAAIEDAAAATGIPVAVSGAGSQVLAAQVRAGVPVDLVVLADHDLAKSLVVDGLSEPEALMHTGLSVVGRPGLGTTDLAQALTDPALTIVLADVGVPLGDATRTALEVEGIVLDVTRVVSLEDSAASVLAKVATGAADLAVVFTANARLAERNGRAIELGSLAPGEVVVTTWVQWASPRGEALARALRGVEAGQALVAAGFELA